jgi:hypothetical protein
MLFMGTTALLSPGRGGPSHTAQSETRVRQCAEAGTASMLAISVANIACLPLFECPLIYSNQACGV